MNEQTVARVALFLRDLGQALHVSGAPAHDLERVLNEAGGRLGVRVEGFAVLTFLALNVVSGSQMRRVEMLRLPPYDYNMARLTELQALSREIDSSERLDAYVERLASIMRAPPPWSGWRFVSMGFFLSAALAAQALAQLFPNQMVFVSAVAGVVFLLPGFMFTVAMSELATQNYLAGTGRLTGAFVLLFLMGAGLAIGAKLGAVVWPAIAALGVSLLAVLQAPLRALPVSVGACLLAWAVYSLVSAGMGNVVGAFAGSLAVASAGHVYQYLSGRPCSSRSPA